MPSYETNSSTEPAEPTRRCASEHRRGVPRSGQPASRGREGLARRARMGLVERAEAALDRPLGSLLLDATAERARATAASQLSVLLASLMAWEAVAPVLDRAARRHGRPLPRPGHRAPRLGSGEPRRRAAVRGGAGRRHATRGRRASRCHGRAARRRRGPGGRCVHRRTGRLLGGQPQRPRTDRDRRHARGRGRRVGAGRRARRPAGADPRRRRRVPHAVDELGGRRAGAARGADAVLRHRRSPS